MIINITVAEKRAAVIGTPVIVCGNSDYSIEFDFDAEWEGLDAKTARFVWVQNGALKKQDQPFTGNTVAVPVLTNTRSVRVGVFAGDLHTTTPAVIRCDLSILCGTEDAVVVKPDPYLSQLGLYYYPEMVLDCETLGVTFGATPFLKSLELTEWSPTSASDTKGGAVNLINGSGIERLIAPKLAYAGANWFAFATALKSVQLGSIGHPVQEIANRAFYFCYNADLEITIFVDAATLADIPAAVTQYAPWGATKATIIYRNSTTGEVITA